jgi:hypothetical protein
LFFFSIRENRVRGIELLWHTVLSDLYLSIGNLFRLFHLGKYKYNPYLEIQHRCLQSYNLHALIPCNLVICNPLERSSSSEV